MNYLGQEPTELTALSDAQRIISLQTPYQNGADVLQLQQKLIAAGYSLPQYGIDGQYGPETKMAVTAFQEDNNLSITGSVGNATWEALNKLKSSSNVPATTSQAGMASVGNVPSIIKDKYEGWWKPLPTTLKVLYGASTAVAIGGVFVAIANKK